MILFLALVAVVAILAGAVASVSGFGIGSLLTPVLTVRVGTKLAVAAVSVPHLAATAFRFWILRKHIDRRVLLGFGLMSAAGGLVGALLHSYAENPVLTIVFGGLLIFTGVMGLTGLSERLRFRGWVAWVAGAVSGALGGLVGNQGGIRSAAMLGFDVPKHAFVATATAVGVIVDGTRMPVYLVTQWEELASLWPVLVTATVGTLIGTVAGERILRRLPEPVYRRFVSALVLALGFLLRHFGWLGAVPLLAGGSLVLGGSAANRPEATKQPETRAMLIEPDELQKKLQQPRVRILDTRPQPEYLKGHIPGAAWVDVKSWQDLGKKEGGFYDARAWGQKVGPLGIGHDSLVVVYGSNLTDTARIWWTLKYLGLQNVTILDGGWQLWANEKRPTDTSSSKIEAVKFEPKFQADRLEEMDPLKKSVRSSKVTVVDARSTDEFTGTEVRGKVGGHIPGSKHLEWKDLLAQDGRFKSREQLRELFRKRGIPVAARAGSAPPCRSCRPVSCRGGSGSGT